MAVSLFDPIKLGAIEAPNRIVMAPLTRGRAGPGFVPNELALDYYRQRASAGLIISEAPGRDLEVARPLELNEIPRVIADYALAAENAKRAGFDGVQLHGANGYLIDQFLRDGSNLRDDDYGGSVDNRIRLLREVTEALIGVWGAGRVSVRLSPNGATQGVDDSAPETLFPVAAAALGALGIGFLELREPGPDGTFGKTDVPKQSPAIRAAFKGPLILNSDYDVAKAEAALASGLADAIAFGRPFIGNPDLVERIRNGAEWAADNPQTWYSPGPEGYTDYPALVPA